APPRALDEAAGQRAQALRSRVARAPRDAEPRRLAPGLLRLGWPGRRRDRVGSPARLPAEAAERRARSTDPALDRGHGDPSAGLEGIPRHPRSGAYRRGRRSGPAPAPRVRLPWPRREVPPDGRSATGARHAHRGRAHRRRRPVGRAMKTMTVAGGTDWRVGDNTW